MQRRWRSGLITGAVMALVTAGTVVFAVDASAATVDTNAWYLLVNRNSGKALDVYNYATSDGARITQWSRTAANNQQWQFVDSGDGWYRVKSRQSNKVLDVSNYSTANGGAIVQYTDRNQQNQQFRLADSSDGHIRLIGRQSGKAVEVQGASTADGANVVQYDDHGGNNQQWQLVRADGGTNPSPSGSASPSPSPSNPAGNPPYASGYETSNTLQNHTIFRPDTLPSERLPIVVWGNGACSANGLSQQNFLRHIASYGFLVIANGAPNGGGSTTAQMLTQSINWAISENSRPGSKYYGKLDTSKIGAAGFSCGGVEAYQVSGDSRISTIGIFSSGLLNDGDDYLLRQLNKPIVYIIGGSGDIAYPNAMDDWGKLPSGLPAFMGNLNVGHGGTYHETNGGEFGRVGALWFRWQLKGDRSAGATFAGSNCGLCTNSQWRVMQKNLSL